MKYSVVILEDDEWVLKGIQKSYNWDKYGFNVDKTFYDANDFLEYVGQHHVDVVFTDIEMPRMSGLELIAKVKFELKLDEILFVIISAYDNYEYMREAINLGVVDYCRKPIERDKTDETLERLRDLLSKNDTSENKVIDNKDFRDLVHYIDTHYMEKLKLNELSKKYFFNANYLCLLFKKNLNMSFSNYVLKTRMEKAKEFLKSGEYSITEIVEKTGYNDYSYFNRAFKKYYGVTPLKFKGDSDEE